MTRFRLLLAVVGGLAVLLALLPTWGMAHRLRYKDRTTCTTEQDTARDFVRHRHRVRRPRGARAHSSAVEYVPAAGAKITSTLRDLTDEDGQNNVVGSAKKTAKTNSSGVATIRHEFNAFGNYEIRWKIEDKGHVVYRGTKRFGVPDRESGPCNEPLPTA